MTIIAGGVGLACEITKARPVSVTLHQLGPSWASKAVESCRSLLGIFVFVVIVFG
jgi:hypothetical protein